MVWCLAGLARARRAHNGHELCYNIQNRVHSACLKIPNVQLLDLVAEHDGHALAGVLAALADDLLRRNGS